MSHAQYIAHSMTTTQIDRLYNRLLRRVQRDCFGADYQTLRLTNPGLYNALRSIQDACSILGI